MKTKTVIISMALSIVTLLYPVVPVSASSDLFSPVSIHSDSSTEVSACSSLPEITVEGNSLQIANGDDTPSLSDYTDFGTILTYGDTIDRTFVIKNTGDVPLNLTGTPEVVVDNSKDFLIKLQPVNPVPAGSQVIFTIRFRPVKSGLRMATVTIASDDSVNNPYTFVIHGTGPVTPDIAVEGNSIEIENGDSTPGFDDKTNFGSTCLNYEPIEHTFVLKNKGDYPLHVFSPGVTVTGSGFTVVTQPVVPVAAGSETSFVIRFNPKEHGLCTSVVSISSNDPDGNPFEFTIQGIGEENCLVTFNDPNLEAAVLEALGKPSSPIYQTELLSLDTIHAEGRGISDLTGLEYWKPSFSVSLYLANNNITDISPLTAKGFHDLDLSNNYISDILPLTGKGFNSLDLSGNYISDISAINDISVEYELCLFNNQIWDITPLADIQLAVLDLSCNLISDISSLQNSFVREINLSHNQITDISSLCLSLTLPPGHFKLQNLDVSYNQISDISLLIIGEDLYTLDISNNLITDISPLVGMYRLVSANCVNNNLNLSLDSVTVDDILTLQSRGVNISYYPQNSVAKTNILTACLMETPTTKDLLGVWENSPTDAFATGSDGTILHYDGNSWSQMESGTTETLHSVWGSSGDDVYAIGDNVMLHYDGTTWTLTGDGGSCIWGSASGSVYIMRELGPDTGVLITNGIGWSCRCFDLWGTADGESFIVGKYYDNGLKDPFVAYHDGNKWSEIWKDPTVTPEFSGLMHAEKLSGIWASSSDDICACGTMRTILHYDGNRWTWLSITGDDNGISLYDVWGGAPGNAVFVGGKGTILHYVDDTLLKIPVPTTADLYDIWGSSTEHLFAVGQNGTIVSLSRIAMPHTISASAGPGGDILPSGDIPVSQGGSQSFTINPAPGYEIADVLVDGLSIGAVPDYTFTNVTENHTIQADFVLSSQPQSPVVIDAETDAAGTAITVTFDKPMADPAGKHNQFSYRINSGSPQSFYAAAPGSEETEIVLTISGSPIVFDDTVTISYAAGDVSSADGYLLESFTDRPVTNNVESNVTVIRIIAPDTVHCGEQYPITITVEPHTDIAGIQFTLLYDPAMVSIDSVEEGDLLKQDGAETYFTTGTVDAGTGRVAGVAGVIITPGQTVSGSGVFATISVTAGSEEGVCEFKLSGVMAGDMTGLAVPVSSVDKQILQTIANRAPVLNEIEAKSANENELLEFSVSAQDPDGDTLTYSAHNLPEGAQFDAETATFSWTPRYNQAGVYTVRFEVTDGELSDYQEVTITIVKLSEDWDVNGDGATNILDMILIGQHWGETGLAGWIQEDANEDGIINVLDMIIIGQHWTE